MIIPDLINIGLSEQGNDNLDYLKELDYFAEKIDAYRFAVAMAIAAGVIPPEISKRVTFLNVGSFDPDQAFKKAVEMLLSQHILETTPYRLIERLADWGVKKLVEEAKLGRIDFEELIDRLSVLEV